MPLVLWRLGNQRAVRNLFANAFAYKLSPFFTLVFAPFLFRTFHIAKFCAPRTSEKNGSETAGLKATRNRDGCAPPRIVARFALRPAGSGFFRPSAAFEHLLAGLKVQEKELRILWLWTAKDGIAACGYTHPR